MLGLTRQSRTERARDALAEAVTYASDLARDKRLRSSIRAAYEHGTHATRRVREDVGAERMASRLATDKKLRKDLSALVSDLEKASERLRRRRRHRIRNAVLIGAGTGAAVAATLPPARRWLTGGSPASQNGDVPEVTPTV